jgi:hypothetical protein
MSDSKASAIAAANNYIYDAINGYSNTLMPMADQVLTKYGIDPFETIDVSHLTAKERGALLVDLVPFLKAMGEEIATKDSERILIEAGFDSMADAYGHVADYYAANVANKVKAQFAAVGQIFALLEGLIDVTSLSALVGKMVAIRAEMAKAVPAMDRI